MTNFNTIGKSSRIMIVDRSEVARSIIAHILQKEMHDAYIVTCGSAEEALEYLHREKFDLITTSLLLPGLDGLDLCHEVRKSDKQHLTPVIVVSSDADTRLLREGFSAGVTDYFNKSLGYKRLVEFIKDVSQRHSGLVGRVLYVEDSLSTAQTTQTLMERHGLYITHTTNGEEALELLKEARDKTDNAGEDEAFDVVFTDFFLEGQMTGGDLLYAIRTQLHYSRQEMPVLVITIADNEKCQAEIFHAGANDFITKPVIEEVLIARIKSLLLVKHQYNVLQRYSRDMYRLSITDSLTGVRNKPYLFEEGPSFINRHSKVCMMMLDIDHFEIINDVQGHIIGDHVLHVVGKFLNDYFANQEILVVRFAGKKFTVLLAECTLEKGKKIAEDLRKKVIALKPEGFDITVSVGLTSSEDVVETTLNTLISDADNALHTAQIQGYNRTCVCVTHKDIRSL